MENPIIGWFALVNGIDVVRHRRIGNTTPGQGRLYGRRWQRYVTLIVLLLNSGLFPDDAGAAERPRLFRIGVLTESWEPTVAIIGLRDGLLALGYREDEQFAIGVRFTQGDLAALPAAAQQLVRLGVDLVYVSQASAAKAAQMTTVR